MKPRQRGGTYRAACLQWLLVFCCLAATWGLRAKQSSKYLLASFPDLGQVNYIRVPDPTWRPLILEGLNRPKAIAVDPYNMRIFAVDEAAMTVVWFKLLVLPSGLLMTDGRSHVVASTMQARSIGVDDTGSLFIAGRYDPGLPIAAVEAVFKYSPSQIAASAVPNVVQEPTNVWTSEAAASGAPASAQLTAPSAVAVDALSVYWGNANRPSGDSGSLVRGSLAAPVENAEDYAWVLANNVDAVDAIVLTAADVYYSAGDQLYGVPKQKSAEMCSGASCPAILQADGNPPKITAMAWDGEGTVFAAEKGGTIIRFACGSLSTHIPTKVCDAPGIYGVSLFAPLSTAPRRASIGISVAALLVAVALLTELGRAPA